MYKSCLRTFKLDISNSKSNRLIFATQTLTLNLIYVNLLRRVAEINDLISP